MSNYQLIATVNGNGIYGGCNDFGEFSNLDSPGIPMFNYGVNDDYQQLILARSDTTQSNKYKIIFDFGNSPISSSLYISFNNQPSVAISANSNNGQSIEYDVNLFPPNGLQYAGDILYIYNNNGCSPINISIKYLN